MLAVRLSLTTVNKTQMSTTHPENDTNSGTNNGYPLDKYTAQPAEGNKGDNPYYHSSAPSISMPKGGGALKGIDEKFTVNAVNGTSSLDFNLPLTPARGGFTPALSVSYNSGSGNSEFGLGWGLSLPSILRRTDKKLPEYNDAEESDVFILAGAEDLQPSLILSGSDWIPDVFDASEGSNSYTIKRYRPRTEGLFARIELVTRQGADGSWWKVTTKENIVTFYGLTAEARLAAPGDATRIFKWLPQVAYDNKGNVQQYFYVTDDDPAMVPDTVNEQNRKNGLSPFTNVYLKSVKYCNRTPYNVLAGDVYDISAAMPPDAFLMECVLDYGDHDTDMPTPAADRPVPVRIDPFSDFHAGFEVRTYRRCVRALMFHYFDEMPEGFPLVRSLDFSYRLGPNPTGYAEADQIVSILQYGYKPKDAAYFKKSLPAVTIDYQPLAWNTDCQIIPKSDTLNLPQGLTGPYNWTDLWGEGLPGILTEQPGNGWYYNQNLGNATFTPAIPIAPKPSFAGFPSTMQWEDLNADGRRQLVSRDTATPGYFELDDDQQWQSFIPFQHNINIDWEDPYTRLVDLDGDGRPDVLLAQDTAFTWYRNEGTEGYTIGGYSPIFNDEELSPKLLYNDLVQSIFLADMNGDGLTDLVRIRNGEVSYWPNMGFGRFGAKVAMANAPVFDTPELFDPHRITLSDISATGAPDIIYIAQGNNCRAYINQAGNAFDDGTNLGPIPGTDQFSKITVIDLLGTGTPCIVWSSPLPQYEEAPLRYMNLMGGNKPYLMTSYDNGLGKTVEMVYKQSTEYYLQDAASGTPWATNLPFAVHCVSNITTTDEVSQTIYTQVYSYHHGYYDHPEREFRGFGRVDTIDTDMAVAYNSTTEHDLDQFPVLTKTWYHTGAWMRDKTLLDAYAQEYYATDWAELPLEPEIIPAAVPGGPFPGIEAREAYRALKGQALRQEVYALDGSPLEGVPYTVATHAYSIKEIQPKGDNLYAVFISYAREGLSFSCERNTHDPRVIHELTLAVDEYGNILESAKVAYPRRGTHSVPAEVAAVQARMLCTYTVTTYTNDVLTNGYHLRTECEINEWELTGMTMVGDLWTPDGLYEQFHMAAIIDYVDTPTTGVLQKRMLNGQRNLFYNNNTDTVLTLGTIVSLGIPYQQYHLAINNGILTNADYYNGRVTTAMLEEGGYLSESDIAQFPSPVSTNYWLPSGTIAIDTAHFYMPTDFFDPWGNKTSVEYWDNEGANYYLLPQKTTDAIGSVNEVLTYNWYNLQPLRIKDINNNITEMLFDALGMPVAMALKGKDDGTEGDTLDGMDPESMADQDNQVAFFTNPESVAADLLKGATWRTVYNLFSSPAVVGMIAREQHYSILPESPMLIRLTYTDGMGRIAMHKLQAAPPEGETSIRWIGNGKTVYNNKGNAVMQYEPYFSNTPAYDAAEQAAAAGITSRMHYDALNRLVCTDLPDGSYTLNEWDSWMEKVYDNNDTLSITNTWYINAMAGTPEQQDAATKALKHADTPTVIHLDTLSRHFYTVLHNRYPDETGTWNDYYYSSYIEYDIDNRRIINNARGLNAHTFYYNMLQVIVRQLSIDAGEQFILTSADGHGLYSWEPDNRQFHYYYDSLRRRIKKEVTVADTATVKVLEKIEYGEGAPSDKAYNLRGKIYKIYDGAGLQNISNYDFKDKPLASSRIFTEDYTQHPDWGGTVIMESIPSYTEEATYDAFERPISNTTPDGGVTRYTYNTTGLLFSIKLENVGLSSSLNTEIINEIYYDAKEQRIKIKYENSATTLYTYDPFTFRITNIMTVRTGNTVLQNLVYWYDPKGNITFQKDNALQNVYFNGTVARPENDYTYDALYRLITVKGRELTGNNGAPVYNDRSRKGIVPVPVSTSDTAAMRPYIQYYAYDEVGNMLQIKHTVTGGTGNWTRIFTIDTLSNRLTHSSIGSDYPTPETYSYDARGNMTDGMNHLIGMVYNDENRLEMVIQSSTLTAYYQYDLTGKRIRKVNVNSSAFSKRIRKYINNWEVYQNIDTTTATIIFERQTLQVPGIAIVDTPTIDTTSSGELQLLRYQYRNNTNTATLELDIAAAIISYEEYYPFGSTSFQSGRSLAEVNLKRYRFTSKEKDEETGFYYHGARYYVPWLARWAASEPLNNIIYNVARGDDGTFPQDSHDTEVLLLNSSYQYVDNNPVIFIDPNGEVTVLVGALIGAIVEIASQILQNIILHKENIFDIDWADVLTAALTGALTEGFDKIPKLVKLIKAVSWAAKAGVDWKGPNNKQNSNIFDGSKDGRDFLIELVANIFGGSLEHLSDIGKEARYFGEWTKNSINTVSGGLVLAMTEKAKDTAKEESWSFRSIGNFFKEKVQQAKKWITGKIDQIKNWFGGFKEKIMGLFGKHAGHHDKPLRSAKGMHGSGRHSAGSNASNHKKKQNNQNTEGHHRHKGTHRRHGKQHVLNPDTWMDPDLR